MQLFIWQGVDIEDLEYKLKLVNRAVELRRTRRIPPIWIDDMRVSIAESDANVWDRRRVGWAEFEALIVAAEAAPAIARKPAGSEVAAVEMPQEQIA